MMAESVFTPFHGEDDEWYTPVEIIEFARTVLDGIALDPASSVEANKVVRADRWIGLPDDGLALSWKVRRFGSGGVFVNPPYGKGNVTGRWWRKMKAEFDAGHFGCGLFLANAKAETAWFQDALDTCPVLLIRGRLSFWKPDRASQTGYFGSALVLLSRPAGDPLAPYNGSPTSYIVPPADPLGGHPLPDEPPLARFIDGGRGLGQIVIAI